MSKGVGQLMQVEKSGEEQTKNKEKISAESDSEDRLSRKQKKKKERRRSRSLHRKKSRSQDTRKKNKKKHKHRNRSSSSRDQSRKSRRSPPRGRSRQRKKYRNDAGRNDAGRNDAGRNDAGRNRNHADNNNRGSHRNQKDSNMPLQIPMPPIPNEVQMPPIPGQRRKRQRSRSPLDYYRKNQNNNDGQFWDSFSWVPRISYTPNVSTSTLANTKKMRRMMITNIPYEIGITEDDLREIITRFMTQNYLKDQMNNYPVVNLEINQADRSVAVELSSVQETCRMCRMEKIQLMKGLSNGIVRLGDSIYGNSIITQAQSAGKAQAAAFAAINVLENKKTNFTVDASNKPLTSTLLRITNAVTPYMATHLDQDQWNEYFEDLIEGFSQFGTIIHNFFVKEAEKDICADPGNLFIEYQYKQNAQAAMSEMQDKYYDERRIKLFYIPRELYYRNFKPKLTPPVLPPPLKTVKPK